VVGRAIEAVVGRTLDHCLRIGLFAPLGMRDASVSLSSAQEARLAPTHRRAADGSFAEVEGFFNRGVQFAMGGGALLGTGRDYLRFLRMFLNKGMHEGMQVLSPESIAEMSRNQLAPGVTVTPMISCAPERSNDAEFFPGMAKHWSTAFMINTEPAPTGRRAGSLAWAGIANTYFWIDPSAGVGGVFMTQILPFADRPALDAFAAFERAVYGLLG
jgi:CubicO group peptidase (beta-lactamase class C family)